jgi:isoleucyl-tRNA synthetase
MFFIYAGSQLSDLTYSHPTYNDNKSYRIIISDIFAPAHSSDDFLLSIKNNLQCINAVDLREHLNCPSIEDLHGRNALDRNAGIQSIIKYLNSNLLHHYELIHSYPYD